MILILHFKIWCHPTHLFSLSLWSVCGSLWSLEYLILSSARKHEVSEIPWRSFRSVSKSSLLCLNRTERAGSRAQVASRGTPKTGICSRNNTFWKSASLHSCKCGSVSKELFSHFWQMVCGSYELRALLQMCWNVLAMQLQIFHFAKQVYKVFLWAWCYCDIQSRRTSIWLANT